MPRAFWDLKVCTVPTVCLLGPQVSFYVGEQIVAFKKIIFFREGSGKMLA